MAIKQGGNDLTVANMDESKYPTVAFGLDPKQVLSSILPSRIDTIRASDWQPHCAEGGSRASHLGQLLPGCLQGELVCCLRAATNLVSVIHTQYHCCSPVEHR